MKVDELDKTLDLLKEREDLALDPEIAAQFRDHFSALVDSPIEPAARANAQIALGKISSNLKPTASSLREAIAYFRQGIEGLDSFQFPAESAGAWLDLAATLLDLAGAEPEQREIHFAQALAALRAADYLLIGLFHQEALRAQCDRLFAHVSGGRFLGDREQNLFDAIAAGERALPFYRENSGLEMRDYGALLNQMANCYARISGIMSDRDRIERAQAFYLEGNSIVDAARFPRLKQVHEQGVRFTSLMLERGDFPAPEMEMVERFQTNMADKVQRRDLSGAKSSAYGFLRWAWSLPEKPNAHIAAAYLNLTRISVESGEAAEATRFASTALAYASAIIPPGHRWYSLVETSRAMLTKVLEITGQKEKTQEISNWALNAYAQGRGHLQAGAQLIESDPAGAFNQFEAAVNFLQFDPDIRFYRGVMAMQRGDWQMAEAEFGVVLFLLPESVPALANRATVRLQTGDHAGAREDLEALLKLEPENQKAIQNLAWLQKNELEALQPRP